MPGIGFAPPCPTMKAAARIAAIAKRLAILTIVLGFRAKEGVAAGEFASSILFPFESCSLQLSGGADSLRGARPEHALVAPIAAMKAAGVACLWTAYRGGAGATKAMEWLALGWKRARLRRWGSAILSREVF